MNTKDQTFIEVFSNGKKNVVPRFQRDYSWEEENWVDLWDDMILLLKNIEKNVNEQHYMGYLVLQKVDENMTFKVIDGQQRLTTFSLLILAAIKRLKELNPESKRIGRIRRSFIGDEALIDLKVENKLALNRNNDYYYRDLVNGKEIPKRNVKKTTRLMSIAFDYFYDCFKEFSEEIEISKLIDQLSKKTLFTVIYLNDELNAYKVFETLNDRGVKLSSSDLLKNHLFSLICSEGSVPDEVLDRMDQKWTNIGENIGTEDYSDYILTHWNSNHFLTRKRDLFKNIKKEIKDEKKANIFLNDLANNSQLYGALLNSSNEFWKESQNHLSIKKDLDFLSLFNISKPRILLMSVYLNFEKDFSKILSWVKIFSLRYDVVCKGHAKEVENLYNKICLNISKGCKTSEIKEGFMKLYPDDKKFEKDFSEKTFPITESAHNKKARYFLTRIEEFLTKKDIDETFLTVEHILPLNPYEEWIEYFGENHDSFKDFLGNMALVDSRLNKRLGQENFEEKKKMLSKTNYSINNLESYVDWDGESVSSRQKRMSQTVKKIWRIN